MSKEALNAPALPIIGTKFLYRRTPKASGLVVWTVRDIWTTTNASGKVVRVVYRCSHEFMGCCLESEFLEVSIQMAIADYGVPG